jgi:hypothetical protein
MSQSSFPLNIYMHYTYTIAERRFLRGSQGSGTAKKTKVRKQVIVFALGAGLTCLVRPPQPPFSRGHMAFTMAYRATQTERFRSYRALRLWIYAAHLPHLCKTSQLFRMEQAAITVLRATMTCRNGILSLVISSIGHTGLHSRTPRGNILSSNMWFDLSSRNHECLL